MKKETGTHVLNVVPVFRVNYIIHHDIKQNISLVLFLFFCYSGIALQIRHEKRRHKNERRTEAF